MHSVKCSESIAWSQNALGRGVHSRRSRRASSETNAGDPIRQPATYLNLSNSDRGALPSSKSCDYLFVRGL